MVKPRTVVLAVAARGELLDVARGGVCALGNLLCLSMPPEEGLPRLGICSLSLSPTTGKAQLQVRLRPGELNLRDFHAAALKLNQGISPEALDGSQVALALQSLAQFLLKDADSKVCTKSITLITDRLPPADDFTTYLEMASTKGVGLDVVVLCEGGTAGAVAAGEGGWAAAQAARPGLLSVSIVEVAGKHSTATVARALLGRCTAAPGAAILDFGAPLLGALRSLTLESHPLVRPLALGACHATLCACHGAPVALRTPATGGCAPLALHRRLCCPVTGGELDPKTGCVQNGKAVCLGDSPAAVIHLNGPITLNRTAAGAAAGTAAGNGVGGPDPAVLRVLHRVTLSSVNASFLVGPAVLLSASGGGGGANGSGGVVTVGVEGQAVEVMPQQVLGLVVAGLAGKGEGLLCSSAWDVGAGPSVRSGLFRRHYLLLPSSLTPESDGKASLIAFRVAAMEELEPRRDAATVGVGVPPPPPAVVAAVATGLDGLQLGPFSPLDCSCRVHEVVDMLCCESRPAPKPTATAVAAAVAENGAVAQGAASGRDGGGGGQLPPEGRGRGVVRRR